VIGPLYSLFIYKKLKLVSGKADKERQKALEKYKKELKNLLIDDFEIIDFQTQVL